MEQKYNPKGAIRMGCGCCLIEIVIVLILLWVFAGCASHREVCGITEEDAYLLDQATTNIGETHASDNDSIILSFDINDVETEESVSETDLDEIINEHIVETTDSAGNKTTTTDRTIRRKQKDHTKDTHTNTSQQSGAVVDVSKHEHDSTYANIDERLQAHWENRDSISQKPVTANKDNRSWWIKLVDLLKYFVFGFLLGVFSNLVYKYIRCK